MKQYFNPDISSLREVPDSVKRQVLGLEDDDAAPDLAQVDRLLHMIRQSREYSGRRFQPLLRA